MTSEPRQRLVAVRGDRPRKAPTRLAWPGSGDAALAAAAERAASTREKNIADLDPLPIPADTANVRQGPELNPACLSLLPLVGVWRGTGLYGNGPRDEGPHFGQQLVISHDGRDFLRYESITWLLDESGRRRQTRRA